MSKAVLKKKYLVLGLGVLLVGAVLFSVYIGTKDEIVTDNSSGAETQENSEAEALAVLERLGGEDEEYVDPKVEITSPEGDRLMQGQANLFNADLAINRDGKQCLCRWQFYLNQYDQEELYKTQDTNCANDTCRFTSYVEDSGQLRLKIDMILKDYQTEEEEIIASDERNYKVSP